MGAELKYQDVAYHVPYLYLSRGVEYFQRGAVSDIEAQDGTVSGYVKGSAAKAYATSIKVGEKGIKSSHCSCPMGGKCKHVAALGLAALQYLGGGLGLTLKIESDTRTAWERSLSSIVGDKTNEDDEISYWDLSIMVRVKHDRRFVGEDEMPQIYLRPRVFDSMTGRSAFKISWPDTGSFGYYSKQVKLSAEQSSFLEQLTVAMSVDYGSGSRWEVVKKERASAVWSILKQSSASGVKIIAVASGEEIKVSKNEFIREIIIEDASKDGIRMREGLFLQGKEVGIEDVVLVGDPPAMVFLTRASQSSIVPYSICSVRAKKSQTPALIKPVTIPKDDVKNFQNRYARNLADKYNMRIKTKKVRVPEKGVPRGQIVIKKARRKEPGIIVNLNFAYDNVVLPLSHSEEEISLKGKVFVIPDKYKEAVITDRLSSELWFLPDADEGLKDKYVIMGIKAADFINLHVPEIEKEKDIDVIIAENVPRFTYDVSDPDVRFNVNEDSDSPDWFDLNITVKISGEVVPFAALFEALAQEEEEFMLPSGRFFPLNHPSFLKLKNLIVESGKEKEVSKGEMSISRYQVDYWDELTKLGVVDKQSQKWRRQMKNMAKSKVTSYKPPKSLKADLRDYQRQGYSWLRFLYNNGMGGILADDMGLGKTVQMIALLASRPKKSGPVLIIAPTSVTDTWESEIAKFAPSIKTLVMRRGPREHLYKEIGQADAVIISYALVWRDQEQLLKHDFDVCVLDEAQMVKNYQSKLYSLVRKIRAKRKFALTGTPMENSVLELWAISSVAAPGLFAPPEQFREQFQRPIEKHQDGKALKKLRARIKPFFMRRTKDQVEAQLPPKTIQTQILDLHEKHRHAYDVHLQRERKRILGLLAEGGLRSHRFEILKSITRMRQLALHPGLINKRQKNMPNAKLDEMVRQVRELAAEGRKALIFSQFTSFLSYVKEKLEEESLPYLYLDGSTRDRGKLVRQFQAPACQECAFVISLKAGGVGLTLTAADYCFILDPWWNPAVENQAIDRTHRIGQNKHVHVFKMIGKGTIEEKVLALQEKKAKLFRDVVDGDGVFAKGITDEDIRMLIE